MAPGLTTGSSCRHIQVEGGGLSTTQGTEIGQEVETAGKLPWPKCLTSLGLGNTYKDEVS